MAHEKVIYTVGHSNLTQESFFALLSHHGIGTLADVRAFPSSRRHPHFNREALAEACRERGLDYLWLRDLGGRRKPSPGSPHTAWQVDAVSRLRRSCRHRRVCSRTRGPGGSGFAPADRGDVRRGALVAVPPATHLRPPGRSRGWRVLHVMGTSAALPHELSNIARLDGQRIVYDVGTTAALDFKLGTPTSS